MAKKIYRGNYYMIPKGYLKYRFKGWLDGYVINEEISETKAKATKNEKAFKKKYKNRKIKTHIGKIKKPIPVGVWKKTSELPITKSGYLKRKNK